MRLMMTTALILLAAPTFADDAAKGWLVANSDMLTPWLDGQPGTDAVKVAITE